MSQNKDDNGDDDHEETIRRHETDPSLSSGALHPPLSLADLPPRVTTRVTTRQRQATGGTLLVGSLLIAFLVVSCSTMMVAIRLEDFATSIKAWTIVAAVVIGTQAVATLVCLTGVLFANPGIVPRTRETCFPIPTEILPWLLQQQTTQQQQQRTTMAVPNNNDVAACSAEAYLSSSGGRDTYCTRCLVWRRQFTTSNVIRYFHCQICQTCVAHYDHHCDVFGRCIAGKVCTGTTGNITYFYGLLVLAGSGYLTCLALMLVALLHVWKKAPAWMVVLVFVAGVAVLQYCCVPQCMRRLSASLQSSCVNGLVGLLFGKPTTTTR